TPTVEPEPAPPSAAPAEIPWSEAPKPGSRHHDKQRPHAKRAATSDAVLRIRTKPNVDAKITIQNDDQTIHGSVYDGRFTLAPGKYHIIISNRQLDLWTDCGMQSIEGSTVLVANMESRECTVEH